jgi:hypothetical protein
MKDEFVTELFIKCIVSTFIIITSLGIRSNFAHADEWHISQITETSLYFTVPVIAVDENRVAHSAWITAPHNLYYANSNNNWLPIRITNMAAYESPSIFIDKTNAVYVAWVDRRNGPNGDGIGWDVYYATSLDGWVNHLVTAGPTVACKDPSIAVDDAGDIHITYVRSTTPSGEWPYNHQLFYTNKSSGWAEERVSSTGYSRIYWSDMDIGDNGVVHIVFSNAPDSNHSNPTSHIWYANSANNWINVQIDSYATTNWYDNRQNPSIDVDSDNIAHVVWEDQRNTIQPEDPLYHGLPNRTEVYYANSDDAWANIEIALPIDTTGPRVKKRPAIFVQNSLVHVCWIQKETDDDISQGNLLYSNSSNWDNAVNISNYPDSPIYGELLDYPGHEIYFTSQGLAVDKNGFSHVIWFEVDNSNNMFKLLYASNQPIVENQPPVAICQDVTVSTKPGSCSSNASADDGSFDPDADPIILDQTPSGPYDLGKTDVTLTVTDDQGASDTCDATVTVIDKEAPVISSVDAYRNILWPPNHKMKTVFLSVDASDNCNSICKITSVASNEPIIDWEYDFTRPDWVIIDDLTVKLRAEHSLRGHGRVYTITVECADSSGNSSTGTTMVKVPYYKPRKIPYDKTMKNQMNMRNK